MDEQSVNSEEYLLNDSFVRWLRGSADEREELFWNDWVKQHPDNRKLVAEARQILQGMEFEKADASDLEEELGKLNASIDSQRSFDPVSSRRPDFTRSKIYRYVSAAAVLLLIATAGYFVLDQQFDSSPVAQQQVTVQTKVRQEVVKQAQPEPKQSSHSQKLAAISTADAEQKTLILNDGTKVVLNANSSLQYPGNYTGKDDITVQLEGEAYFEVSKDNQTARTFSVQTKDGMVTVLGTKFSVQSKDENTQVALQEGSVEVQMNNDAEQPNYRMSPGELAQFSRSGAAIEVAKVNPEVYTSWTKSNLRFDDTSLSEIIWRIEQTYGVDVFVRDKSLLSKKISGSIQNNDLNVFLKALSELLHTTVEQKSTTIIIGT